MDAEVFVGEKHLCQARVISGNSRLMLQVVSDNDQQDENDSEEDEPTRTQRRGRTRSSRTPIQTSPIQTSPIQTERPARARSESREARPTRKRASTRGEK